MQLLKITVLLSLMLIQLGCASLGAKPWERNVLATPAMSVKSDQMDLTLDDHIYFSKEGTSGGRGFAGGGCGCN
jgi:hypothetical protein